jgi:hypothetical protein
MPKDSNNNSSDTSMLDVPKPIEPLDPYWHNWGYNVGAAQQAKSTEQIAETGKIEFEDSVENSAIPANSQPTVNMPQQATQNFNTATAPQINKVEELFNQAVNLDKKDFITVLINWVTNNATASESRQVQIAVKERYANLKQQGVEVPKLKTLISRKVEGQNYFVEKWYENGKRKEKHLGKNLVGYDLSEINISNSAKIMLTKVK